LWVTEKDSAEQIVGKRREVQFLMSTGAAVDDIYRKVGISGSFLQPVTSAVRRQPGLRRATRLTEVVKEYARLGKLVADLFLKNTILKST